MNWDIVEKELRKKFPENYLDAKIEAELNFSTNITLMRKERGWTQAEVCKRLTMKQPELSRYETGRTSPTLDSVARFAFLFGVSVPDLLSYRKYDFPTRSE